MITEDYVNFETAKLLKEKGFDEGTYHCYTTKGVLWFEDVLFNHNAGTDYSAPTLQMAMKWLREVHKLYINIWADPKDAENNDFDIIFRAQVYNGSYKRKESRQGRGTCKPAYAQCI